MKHTNICIVGAGPGGICAALSLAKRNIPCTLIDKATFPRDKVDGDILPTIVMRSLFRIIPELVDKLEQAEFSKPVWGNHIFAPNGKKITIHYPSVSLGEYKDYPSCYATRREDFDNMLLEEIRNEPLIEFIEGQGISDFERIGNEVILKDKKGKFQIQTPLVFIANGANSALARKLANIKVEDEHCAVAVRGYFEGVENLLDEDYPELYFIEGLLPGILYLARLPNGQVNLNMGLRSDIVKDKKMQLRNLMFNFIKNDPILKKRFANAKLVGRVKGYTLPFGTKKRKLCGDNYMLIGDAAGMIDVASGNGIGNAMISGIMAAEKAESCIAEKNYSASFLQNYHDDVHRKLENYLKMGNVLAPFAGYTRLYGFYKHLLNFIIGRSSNSAVITRLLYESDLDKKLKQPSFYYDLLFKTKSANTPINQDRVNYEAKKKEVLESVLV